MAVGGAVGGDGVGITVMLVGVGGGVGRGVGVGGGVGRGVAVGGGVGEQTKS